MCSDLKIKLPLCAWSNDFFPHDCIFHIICERLCPSDTEKEHWGPLWHLLQVPQWSARVFPSVYLNCHSSLVPSGPRNNPWDPGRYNLCINNLPLKKSRLGCHCHSNSPKPSLNPVHECFISWFPQFSWHHGPTFNTSCLGNLGSFSISIYGRTITTSAYSSPSHLWLVSHVGP